LLIAGTPLEPCLPKCNNNKDWAISSQAPIGEGSETIETHKVRE